MHVASATKSRVLMGPSRFLSSGESLRKPLAGAHNHRHDGVFGGCVSMAVSPGGVIGEQRLHSNEPAENLVRDADREPERAVLLRGGGVADLDREHERADRG